MAKKLNLSCGTVTIKLPRRSKMKIGGIQKFSTVDYPGYVCAAIFTIGCNMRCGYCHNPELVLPEQFVHTLPQEDILMFLQKRIGQLEAVAISGGEPTDQPDLADFIRTVKNMGYLVKLDSNGTRPWVLEQLVSEKLVDFIAMDIKGPLSKYVQIAARPVDLEAIKRSIGIVKSLPGHEFRTTIVRSQLQPSDFEQIGELVEGAGRYALQHFRSNGTLVSPQFANAQSFTEAEMQLAQKIIKKYVKECVVH